MRRGLSVPPAADPLQAALDGRLDTRLDRKSAAPVALGLSGGGDSVALLHLAVNWCARAGRPLLALTVDHGLSPESRGWTARAGHMAARAGAAWRRLAWTGPKPATGLPAAARAARHARLAEAAREAGAAVVLLAHTAEDHAETEALRAGPAPGIGRLHAWAPSPAWPQGRGVFLLRPLLEASRAELRAWLRARDLEWMEDPANADPRFARARMRAAAAAPSPPPRPGPAEGFGCALADGRLRLPRARLAAGGPDAYRSLSAALACASGAEGRPRREALEALLGRLCAGERPAVRTGAGPTAAAISTLHGARVASAGDDVVVGRDLGRRAPPDLPLEVGRRTVWDGRFEATAAQSGWRIGVAAGRLARLPPSQRALLQPLAPALRRAHPVIVRGDEVRLRSAEVELLALSPLRFDAAVGRIASEAALTAAAAVRTSPFAGTTPEAGSSTG